MPIPPQVRADLKRQKNRTPFEQGLAPSSYEFYYVGRPTQQQLRNHIYQGEKYKSPIGKQCGRRTVIGTMICWQHLRQT